VSIANALTFDIEDWHQLVGQRLTGTPWPCSERAVTQTHHILDMLAAADVKGTFFILASVAITFPGLVREIHEAGHEVGSHGWSHRLVYGQTPDEFRTETRQSKALLEDIVGVPVRGYRAAEFSVTRASLWALEILAELGFEYDSSVFPIAGGRYGIPESPLVPYRPAAGRELVEVPMTAVDWRGRRWAVGGGGYFRLMPYAVTRAAIARVNADARAAVIYFHPYEFADEPLRLPLPPWQRYVTSARYTWLHNVNRGANRRRFIRLLRDFRFQPISEMLKHGRPDQALL
jgi:polysaccharide deacetylase family protein (PEP-CTERM system associated)